MATTHQEKVSGIYARKMEADGLVSVSFSVQPRAGMTPDAIAKEIVALEQAVERGDYQKLDFGDRNWKSD